MIRVYIADDYVWNVPKIYITQVDANGEITHVAKPVDLVFEPYAPGTRAPDVPTLQLGSPRATEAFLQSFADALQLRKKPSPTDNRLLGQLEATERHLTDLQMLLHLKPNPNRGI